jgi:hypothetical protein
MAKAATPSFAASFGGAKPSSHQVSRQSLCKQQSWFVLVASTMCVGGRCHSVLQSASWCLETNPAFTFLPKPGKSGFIHQLELAEHQKQG